MGTAVNAYGGYQSDQSLLAMVVNIQLPSVVGTVTAVNGNSITIEGGLFDSQAPTIVTSAQTVYMNGSDGSASASSSSVTVGSVIVATGAESTDGTTLNAQRIVVLPASTAGKVTSAGSAG